MRSTVAGSIPVTIAATAEQADRTPADDTRVFDVASTDDTPPRSLRVKGTTLQRPFQTGTDIQLGWSAVDAGTGVSRYDVRYRRGTSAGRFEPFVIWQNRTARTNALFTGAAGSTYCFSVRAVDGAGNLSRYSTEKCTAIPFDDTALSRRGAWAREGSRTALPRRDAALVAPGRRARAAPTCGPSASRSWPRSARRCGSVDVLLGARLLKTVSLDAPVDPHAPGAARAARDRHPRRHAHDPGRDPGQDRAHRRPRPERPLTPRSTMSVPDGARDVVRHRH